MFMRKSGPLIGLDIGSHSVKVVELRPTRSGHQLANLGVAPLPPDAIVDGAILNAGVIVDAIRALLANNNIKTRDVAASVSGHSVIIKKINLPAMTKEELEEQIQWEAEQYIPFDINDVNIDFQILSNEFETEGKMDVLLVAAKKAMVGEYVNVIREAGLRPLIIDVDSFAVETMFETSYAPNPNEVIALVNAGASLININVVRNNLPAFTRDIASGGKQYTEEIQKTLHVGFQEAESIKMGGTTAVAGKEILPQEVDHAMRGVSESLASEIQRSLEFFSATAPEDRISRIFLTGGCARMHGLPDVIEDKTRIPVEVADPFRGIECSEKEFDLAYLREIGPSMGVGVGLALRKAGA
jgi:type IV pilus assembly protein PilM